MRFWTDLFVSNHLENIFLADIVNSPLHECIHVYMCVCPWTWIQTFNAVIFTIGCLCLLSEVTLDYKYRFIYYTYSRSMEQLTNIMLSNDRKPNGTKPEENVEPLSMDAPQIMGSIKREENKQRVPNQQTRWDSSDIAFSPALFVKTPFMVVFEIQGPH